ncbi:MAG: TonB-dependent receptor [Bacteroidota bacterium]
MKYLLLLWLVFAGALLQGQDGGTITGIVSDASDGKPMIAVNISANRRTGTISGEKGAFSLRLPAGTYFIEFYYVGYERVSKELTLVEGEKVYLDIRMAVSSKMLDEVVVSAGKFEQKLSDVTVSLEVLKPQQLSNQNITSLDMILEKTSGISILNGQPSIRGGSGFSYGVGSRVLMLVDDLPMISGDAGDIKWSYMPVENVNQVEIIKGASSVLYGSSALNGVINLRTRFPGNEPRTEVTLFGGAYLEPARKELVWKERAPFYTGTSFSHLRKIGNLDLSLGGNYFKNEGYRELEHEDRIRGNLALRYRFKKVKGLSAGVSASAMYTSHADFILWQNADSGAYRQNPETYAPLTGHRYNIDPYVTYFTPGGDKHTLRTRLYSVGNNTVDETKNSFSKVWYGEYQYLKNLSERFHWTNGFSFMRNTVDAGLFNQHKGSNTAIYSQLDANLLQRLKISTGIRWEVNGLNDELFLASPVVRVGLNYQAGQATYLRASFGQGYRFPSVAEKFVDAKTSGLNIFPNPELEAEWGWSAEVGAKQGFMAGSWSGFIDLAAFWTEYENMIEYNFGYYPPENPTRPAFDYVGFKALNIETARILGSEITINLKGELGPLNVTAMAGYTFMDPVDPVLLESTGRVENDTFVLKYRRRHLLKSDLEVSFWKMFAGINFQFNSTMINVDQAFIDPFLGNQLLPGFPDYWNENRHGYALLDLRLGWSISKSFRMNVLVRNLANVEYLGRPGDLGPPRQITLQGRLTF